MNATPARGPAMPQDAPERYPELLGELLTSLQHELVREGVDKDKARPIAWNVVEKVRDAWGGQILYIPKGDAFDARARYEAIWQAFNGHNHADLARRFGVSEQTIYNAIREMRTRNQLKLDLPAA
jgi:Mor family transcriptional regulator